MKRIILFLTLVAVIFSMCGCSENEDIREPVSFYYCNDISSEENFNDIFVMEVREGAGYAENKPALLSLYLTGPENEEYVSPFPAGLTIVSVKSTDDCVYIVLSDHISKLTGLDLTLACTCLSMTAFELYPCSQVEISAETAPLNEQSSLIFTKDDLVFTDNAYPTEAD